ncbi:MAG: TIGR03790 family protein [Sedimentisphaerales bacterium]
MKKNIHRPKKQEDKKIKSIAFHFILIICLAVAGTTTLVFALEPQQILIIANSDVNESVRLAKYYCAKRAVPPENILKIPLGRNLAEEINRPQYDNILAAAVKKEIQENRLPGEIECLLTLYGVPIKVGPAGPMKNSVKLVPKLTQMLDIKKQDFNDSLYKLNHFGRQEMVDQNAVQTQSYEDTLNHLPDDIMQTIRRIEYIESQDARKEQYNELTILLKKFYGPVYAAEHYPQVSSKLSRFEETELNRTSLILQLCEQDRWSIEKKFDMSFYKAAEFVNGLIGVISDIKNDIGRCKGAETAASVDSELSMVLYKDYDLYRWQKNELLDFSSFLPAKTLMVSRLDGPSAQIATGLVDKALRAEKKGLSGKAYIDTRGLDITREPAPYSFEFFDKSLYSLAALLKNRTSMEVVIEKTASLFAPGSCPKTAIYCGWYSLRKYIDAFEFVPGAVGYHIASLEAADLRNPASSNWCPAMLSHGITATLGPVNEPYLLSFPLPDKFFAELLDGRCLVEAFYRTNPFNSWQLVLIGDPLYKLNLK